MRARTVALVVAAWLASCDGDGCAGGPDGAASRGCQDSLGRAGLEGAALADACRTCCHQEVAYRGTIEGGLCVCRR